MRPFLFCLVPSILAGAALSLPAQQTAAPAVDTAPQPVAATPADAAATAPPAAAVVPAVEGDTPVSTAVKPMSKADEKQQRKLERDAEKTRKEKEKDASYLKLQGDEIVAPTLDADGNAVRLAPCARKDKECQKKRKAVLHGKKIGMKIENGTLTVDGWTGKARLNYDINQVKFLYVSIPGQGTVIASMEQFPNSTEQKKALDGKTLTIHTPDDHEVQITSDNNLVDKKDHSMFVAVDKGFVQPGRFPTIGYGSTAKAPYNWPGVRPLTEKEQKISAKAPPLPAGMQVVAMKLPCQKVAPGEQVKPVKINGILMTPEACPVSNSLVAGERPPDGSGAASTGVPDPATKR